MSLLRIDPAHRLRYQVVLDEDQASARKQNNCLEVPALNDCTNRQSQNKGSRGAGETSETCVSSSARK